MIALAASLVLAVQPQTADALAARVAHVAACQDRQADALILLGQLGQTDLDFDQAGAEASGIQAACDASATALLADAWTAPCGRRMVRIGALASGLADIFAGRRSSDDPPGLIYPEWQPEALRCHQITAGESEPS